MRNRNRGSGKRGRGRMGGTASGPGGVCICTNPNCRHETKHVRGKPCYQQKCPQCGSPMVRK